MKTYRQAVKMLAMKMYHSYMSGDNDYRRIGSNPSLIADILGVHPNNLYVDVEKKFKIILKETNKRN